MRGRYVRTDMSSSCVGHFFRNDDPRHGVQERRLRGGRRRRRFRAVQGCLGRRAGLLHRWRRLYLSRRPGTGSRWLRSPIARLSLLAGDSAPLVPPARLAVRRWRCRPARSSPGPSPLRAVPPPYRSPNVVLLDVFGTRRSHREDEVFTQARLRLHRVAKGLDAGHRRSVLHRLTVAVDATADSDRIAAYETTKYETSMLF